MSFLTKFENAFKKLFGVAPQWVHVAQSVVAFAGPVAVAILGGFAPELVPVAGPIITEIQTDLATASVLIGEGQATPSLVAAITRINDNMDALLAAGHIKSDTAQTQAKLVVAELQAVLQMLPKPAASA